MEDDEKNMTNFPEKVFLSPKIVLFYSDDSWRKLFSSVFFKTF